MLIEPMETADVPLVAAVWHKGWHQAHAAFAPAALVATRVPAEFLDRCARRLDRTWVARVDGAIAGFYMIEDDEIYQFYVDAPFQGRGVAVRLMASAEQRLAGRCAWLACSVGNERAARFYEKSGWHRAGIEMLEVETAGGPQDVRIWRYEKDLTAAYSVPP